MVSIYSPPDIALHTVSWGAVWSCHYQGQTQLQVVDVRTIQSVVAVVPFPDTIIPADGGIPIGPFFVVEKMGLDVGTLGGFSEGLAE